MITSLLGLLAFLVFGTLWLSAQSWFDLLPRRVTRRVGYLGLAVLAGAAYLAPTAFQSGVTKWVDHTVAQAQDKYSGVIEGVVEAVAPRPTPTPSPTVTLSPLPQDGG